MDVSKSKEGSTRVWSKKEHVTKRLYFDLFHKSCQGVSVWVWSEKEHKNKSSNAFTYNILLPLTLQYSRHPSIFVKEWGRFRSAWVWLKKNRGLSGYALIFFKEPGREGSQTHMCVNPALYLARVCRMNLLPNFCSLNYCQRFILFLSQNLP